MTTIFAAIDIEAEQNPLRLSAPTADMAYRDPEIARFVALAVAHDLPPSVFEVPGRVFPWLVPEELWDAPMWVHWVGKEYAHAVDQLAHTELSFNDQISTDLLKRRQVLCWDTAAHSFCTGARGLQDGINMALKQGVLSVFISPTRFASNLARLTVEDVTTLGLMQDHSGTQYRPQEWHSPEKMSAALMASVLLGNEPKTDTAGRSIVLLKTRAFPFRAR
ncbi:hypothetical protein CHU94_05365 [Rhodoferax sp. TH121]|uniref:hypothetical protein n=1 Tax=Rhodoferax sp. TH121 TaxID=2022803 RepID=UPI000B96E3A4|nr:hypothetical protein [Rhodoferax sp. TH121]OYQ41802.1 hypothetical protein CHU94_05365 [Rhodoferax sp. TH121]